MPSDAPHVTDAELAILTELWGAAPEGPTVRDLAERLYPPAGPTQIATVQKLLERLEAKGCVARSRDGRAHRFVPSVDRDALIRGRLDALAEDLCGGSLAPLLSHLVGRVNLDDADLSRIRRLLDAPKRADRRGDLR